MSWIVFVPVIGMAIMACIPSRGGANAIRWTSALTSFVVFALSSWLLVEYLRLPEASRAGFLGMKGSSVLFEEKGRWIGEYNIWYHLGVDGLSVVLVFLTGLLSFLAVAAAWSINKAVKGFHMMYMLLITGMMGVFVALDLFLFYVFWEVMLLPMYFLIGIWGGPRKEYAAIKFFLYTLAGSVLMLVAILVVYMKYHTFSIPELIANPPFRDSLLTANLLFLAFFIAFAVKIPMFPFHTWLPDAHVEAPTAISVILAGVLLKLGGYGILRINFPIFPESTRYFIGLIALFGVINIVYGAFCAMAQTDFKKLVAYSSISHMGYVLLGMAALNPEGMNGAVFQMFNHGLSSAMMFLLVGVLYERAHHREIERFGGIGLQMPKYLTVAIVGFFASLGLPGLSSFVSEIMVFLGAFKSHSTVGAPQAFQWVFSMKVLTMISSLGVVLGAAYLLYTMQRVYLGKPKPEHEGFADMGLREYLALVPLAVLSLVLGIWPNLALNVFSGAMNQLLTLWHSPVAVAAAASAGKVAGF
ncbi:MAG TPA: NADH-quinone oxidoreductase subunit M [Aggregatilineaceae bacterium]|nr:NADH-quinone oxidoreductase subunit M [Aggregatilineaceae bacterium]